MLRGIRCSSADVVTRLQDGQSWLRFPGRIKKFYFFSKTVQPALISTHPYQVGSGEFSLRQSNWSVDFPTQLCVLPRLRMHGATPPPPTHTHTHTHTCSRHAHVEFCLSLLSGSWQNMDECNFCLQVMDSPLTVTTEKNASKPNVPAAVVT